MQVLAIDVDDPLEHLHRFISMDRYGFMMTREAYGVSQALGVDALPTQVIIDRHGVVRAIHVGPTDLAVLRTRLRGVLDEALP